MVQGYRAGIMENVNRQSGVSLSIRAATKNYGVFNVLDAVDLDVGPGEFVSILRSASNGSWQFRGSAGLRFSDKSRLAVWPAAGLSDTRLS